MNTNQIENKATENSAGDEMMNKKEDEIIAVASGINEEKDEYKEIYPLYYVDGRVYDASKRKDFLQINQERTRRQEDYKCTIICLTHKGSYFSYEEYGHNWYSRTCTTYEKRPARKPYGIALTK